MISVTIIVKNGQRCLKNVLESLKSFDEVILADTGSTDNTRNIALGFPNVSFHEIPFKGFGPAHNVAASLAKHDWILSIDSDEVLSPTLIHEIEQLTLEETTVYSIPFHNYFNNKWIKWCGWFPEEHVRLYNKKRTAFCSALVHEGVITKECKIKKLHSPILHYSYETISDFLTKMERYSSLFAEQNRGKKHSTPFIALWHGVGAFCKCFFLKRGLFGGYEGFLISLYNGHTAFYKYLKLYHLNKNFPKC